MTLGYLEMTVRDRDGIPMGFAVLKFESERGNGVPQIFGPDMITPLGNPVQADSSGQVRCYMESDFYSVDIQAKNFTETMSYVTVPEFELP